MPPPDTNFCLRCLSGSCEPDHLFCPACRAEGVARDALAYLTENGEDDSGDGDEDETIWESPN